MTAENTLNSLSHFLVLFNTRAFRQSSIDVVPIAIEHPYVREAHASLPRLSTNHAPFYKESPRVDVALVEPKKGKPPVRVSSSREELTVNLIIFRV